jgi:hypothetical protein
VAVVLLERTQLTAVQEQIQALLELIYPLLQMVVVVVLVQQADRGAGTVDLVVAALVIQMPQLTAAQHKEILAA